MSATCQTRLEVLDTPATLAKIIEEVMPEDDCTDELLLKHSLWVLTDKEIEAGLGYLQTAHS